MNEVQIHEKECNRLEYKGKWEMWPWRGLIPPFPPLLTFLPTLAPADEVTFISQGK